MATETKLQQQRNGNLADLGDANLLPGELGYALDAKRLFIGNTAIALDGDGTKVEFSFNVDLDHAPGESYQVFVGTDPQIESVDYTKSNFVITFTAPPAVGSGNVELRYNSEILLMKPDVGLDVPGLVGLIDIPDYNASTNTPILIDGTGVAGDRVRATTAGSQDFGSGSIAIVQGDHLVYSETIWKLTSADIALSAVAFDGTRYDTIAIKYSLRNTTGMRTGLLNIAVNPVANTYTIADNYTSDVVGASLDHVFSGVMDTGQFVLYYNTTDTESANFSWMTDNFKALV